MARETLQNAKKAKQDEFYTQLTDIEKELRNYKDKFRDKIVFCNCDDPYESNFFKYFAMNFNVFGLKKLIATCYAGSPIASTQLTLFDSEPPKNKTTKAPHKIEISAVDTHNGDDSFDLANVEYLLRNKKNVLTRLQGDGDFRSPECVALLKEADIVVTNPPFSLFREFVAQLVEHEKDFIIIGNTNALTYKETFKLIKENKMRTGCTNFNVGMHFVVPDYWEKYHKIEDGYKFVRVSTSCWFTSLKAKKHRDFIALQQKYTPEKYPHYDNYDAINVDKVTDIPCDWDGAVGVPITFLDKYNPNQFEILGLSRYIKTRGMSKEFVDLYYKSGQTGSISEGHPDLCYYDKKNTPIVPYMRVLIRKTGATK